MAAQVIDAYFDYVSPFAYFLSCRLPDAALRWGVTVTWKPIELHRLSNFEGGLPYSPSKRMYVGLDAARSAEFYGLPIQFPEPFPVQSARALRVALAAQEHGIFDAVHRNLFRAAWAEQRDIGQETVLAECVRAAGGDAILQRAGAAEVNARVLALTQEAESRGVFGVPSVVVNGELFWGNDQLEMIEWRLRQIIAVR